MHDYHAVKGVLERLTAALAPSDLRDVTEIRVRAGAGFSPEALTQAYEMLTPGTPLEGSRLLVVGTGDELGCPRCGLAWAPSPEDVVGGIAICPSCGEPSRLPQGARVEIVAVATTGAEELPIGGA